MNSRNLKMITGQSVNPPPSSGKEGPGENGGKIDKFRISEWLIFLSTDTFPIPPQPSLPEEGREF